MRIQRISTKWSLRISLDYVLPDNQDKHVWQVLLTSGLRGGGMSKIALKSKENGR